MTGPRYELARDIAAIVLVAIACPVALFGGALAGCAADGFSDGCAINGVAFAPLMLVAAGSLAGLLTRGWFGYAILFFGVVVGMFAILILTTVGGSDPVPMDPITAIIATLWFLAPTSIGYVVGRGAVFGADLLRRRRGDGQNAG
jgi:hypothetical protein